MLITNIEKDPMTETEKRMAARILSLEDDRVTGPESLRVTKLPAADKGGKWEICGICDGIEPAVFAAIKKKLDEQDREGAWQDCLQYVLDNTSPIRSWLGNVAKWAAVEFFCRDFYFNAGTRTVAKVLQRSLVALGYKVSVDGIVGQATKRALAECLETHPERVFLKELKENREAFYRDCKQFPVFGKGWLNRTKAAFEFAMSLLAC